MPEPDLPRLVLTKQTIEGLKASLPELPDTQRSRIMTKYDLGMVECRTLMGEEGMVEYFEQVVSGRAVKSVVSWYVFLRHHFPVLLSIMQLTNIKLVYYHLRTVHELLGRLHSGGLEFDPETVNVKQLGSLIDYVDNGGISAKVGKDVLRLMIEGDKREAEAIVEEKGWKQMDNMSELGTLCETIMGQYPDKVKVIQKGNLGVLGFLVGQIMKESKGRANPVVINELLRSRMNIPAGDSNSSANSKQGKKKPKQ